MVAERLVRRSEVSSNALAQQRAEMARSSSPDMERDHRSLRFQIEEDDDIIELEGEGTIDYGAGITNFVNETSAIFLQVQVKVGD